MLIRTMFLIGVVAGAMLPGFASAQMGRGGFGGDALGDLKTQLRSSDEEWKVIGPKLRTLMEARSAVESILGPESQMAGGGGFGGRGGPGGGNDTFAGPSDQSGGGRGFGRGGRGGDFDRRGGFGPGGPTSQHGDFPPDMEFGRRGRRGFGPEGFGPPDFAGGLDMGGPGMGGGGRGRGGDRGGRGNAVLSAMTDLQTTLKDPQSTQEQIQEKIDAVRNARAKAQAQVTRAQKELLELLTDDQQAVLIQQGMID